MATMPPEAMGEDNGAAPEDALPPPIGQIRSRAAGQGGRGSEEGLGNDGPARAAPPHGNGRSCSAALVKGVSPVSLSTTNLTLCWISQPRIPWKDSYRFLFEKGWTYITGNKLSYLFYVSPEFSRLKKREVTKTGVRGLDYFDDDHLKEYWQRE